MKERAAIDRSRPGRVRRTGGGGVVSVGGERSGPAVVAASRSSPPMLLTTFTSPLDSETDDPTTTTTTALPAPTNSSGRLSFLCPSIDRRHLLGAGGTVRLSFLCPSLGGHLAQIGCSADYEAVFLKVHRRRLNCIPVLQMQKIYSIADVSAELRRVAASKKSRSYPATEGTGEQLLRDEAVDRTPR